MPMVAVEPARGRNDAVGTQYAFGSVTRLGLLHRMFSHRIWAVGAWGRGDGSGYKKTSRRGPGWVVWCLF